MRAIRMSAAAGSGGSCSAFGDSRVMNKLIHLLILVGFSYGCLLTWALLGLAAEATRGAPLPAFTRLCVSMRPTLIVLPIIAAAYCAWVCFRTPERVPAWVCFFAVVTGFLVLLGFTAGFAAYLPLMPL
jgi:pimeloyl-ACP methyl ester carboxylesterase